jgi:hypothetical protein
MQLFYFSCDRRITEWIFAEDELRATQLFLEVLIMSGVPPANYWSRAITEEAVPEGNREHFRNALAMDLEGFGELDPVVGWRIVPIADRMKRLLDSG